MKREKVEWRQFDLTIPGYFPTGDSVLPFVLRKVYVECKIAVDFQEDGKVMGIEILGATQE